jgi:hypothetical protein
MKGSSCFRVAVRLAGAASLAATLCAAGAAAWGPPAAEATKRAPIEEWAAASDVVVAGRVLRNRSRWIGKRIVTASDVEPLRVMKGNPRPGEIQVAFYGGTVGEIHQHVTHETTLREGEISVLFLAKPRKGILEELGAFHVAASGARIPLLAPGERESRLENNRRLRRGLEEVTRRVREESK